MLSISQAIRGGGAYYLGGGAEDYYAGGAEGEGTWWGEVAAALGLEGRVTEQALSNLLSGFSPDGTVPLVQNAGEESRQQGWDFTFSAPKSVSVLWSQLPEGWRREIEAIQDAATRRALLYLESVAGLTRRGALGFDLEETKLLFAIFPHFASRARDPQIHTHCVLVNLSLRPDGTTGSLWSRELFRHKMAAGAIYRAEFAALLGKRLSICVARDGSVFCIPGVSEKLVESFSTRRKQVLAALEANHASGAVAAKLAALETRVAKGALNREELLREWQALGERMGWGREKAEWLLGKCFHQAPAPGLLREALGEVTERDSHFPIRDLVRRAAEHAVGTDAGADAVLAIIERARLALVPLGRVKGESRFTTREILSLEEKFLLEAGELAAASGHEVNANVLQNSLRSVDLSEEQKEAVIHVTERSGELALLLGLAGTGKTTLLAAANEVWTSAGYLVTGIALSGKAAAGLEAGAGIPSQTLSSLLLAVGMCRESGLPSPLTEKTVCVLDEAGMVGTRQLSELLHECKVSVWGSASGRAGGGG